MRHQLLALWHQSPGLEHARPDAALDALDEHRVLPADLAVELEQLVDPGLIDVRSEEIVEEARSALGPARDDRAAGEVRLSRKDVEPEVGPEEMELAARKLMSHERRLPTVTKRSELARRQPLRREPVRVRRDVDHCAESGMCDGAVVALQEVLARHLPVRVERELGAEAKLERIEVEDLRPLCGQRT